jgi:hypothetical protein
VEITVTVRSTGEAVRVARPFITPNLVRFTVTAADGTGVPFDGPYVRLAPLEEEDFADLAAGDTLVQTFDLAAHFSLPPGGYTVAAEYRNVRGGPGDDGVVFTAEPGAGVVAVPIDIEVTP